MSNSKQQFSRRKFLQGIAATAGAAATVTGSGLLASSLPVSNKRKDGRIEITLNVDGVERKTAVEARVTLLNALRNYPDVKTGSHIDVTGPKRVCDRASCGACTVIMDGRTVYACTVLAIEAQGKTIETVEGIGTPENPHALQKAFVDCDGLMCGFCTPGFVTSAKNLLDQNPKPDGSAIRRALNGNLCRCGTYNRVFEAVEKAAKGGK